MYMEGNSFWETIEELMNSFWTTTKRKRPNREDLKTIGAFWELWGFSRLGGASEHHVCVSLHFDRVGGSSTWVLWPTYKITAAHSQPHCSEPISALIKGSKQDQQGTAACTWLLNPGPLWLSGPVSLIPKVPLSSCWPAKTTHTHSLHTGHLYIRPLFPNWER